MMIDDDDDCGSVGGMKILLVFRIQFAVLYISSK
jgi:hypothetical protein